MTLNQLIALGFDLSTSVFGRPNLLTPRCSQCSAAVLNGVACHETGCPHEMHECAGCNEIIPKALKYCDECR